MTFPTMNIIHNLLLEEQKRRETARDMAKENRRKWQDVCDELERSMADMRSIEAKQAMAKLKCADEMYSSINDKCSEIFYALSEFEQQDWR